MSKKQRNKVNNAPKKQCLKLMAGSCIHIYTHSYTHKHTCTYTPPTHNSEAMRDNWSDLAQEE